MSDWSNLYYRVDADDRIVEVGGEWDRFARENDGSAVLTERVLGTRLFTHITGEATRLLVLTLFDAARMLEKPIVRTYRCDGPGCKRHMEMRISPQPSATLMLEHRLVKVEEAPLGARFSYETRPSPTTTVRCSMCNRLKASGGWNELELEPSVARLAPGSRAAVIYGICPDCFEAAKLPPATL